MQGRQVHTEPDAPVLQSGARAQNAHKSDGGRSGARRVSGDAHHVQLRAQEEVSGPTCHDSVHPP